MEALRCTACGAATDRQARYCARCGAPQPERAPGERGGPGKPLLLVLVAVVLVLAGALGTIALVRDDDGADDAVRSAATTTAPTTITSTTETTSGEPSRPVDFADMFERVRTGVVQVNVDVCYGDSSGTGFLVGEDLIVTAAHVVSDAASIALRTDTVTASGSVIGLDEDRDLALVQTGMPIRGHIFRLAGAPVRIGSQVAAIGFPLGGPLSITTGTVSGSDRSIETGSASLRDLIQTDAAVNPGNSGGPLMDPSGEVVGVIEAKDPEAEGVGYAVDIAVVRPLISRWRADPVPQPVSDCDVGDEVRGDGERVTVETQHRDAPEVAATLATWAEGINRGDYSRSYALLTPGAQRRTPLAELIDGNDTTVLARITIESMTTAGEGVDDAVVTSTSEQAPEDGPDRQECTNWDMTYRMLLSDDGVWRIDQASNNPGSPAPC